MASKDRDGRLKSRNIKRSGMVGGHKTSVSLYDLFWNELRAIAQERNISPSALRSRKNRKRSKKAKQQGKSPRDDTDKDDSGKV